VSYESSFTDCNPLTTIVFPVRLQPLRFETAILLDGRAVREEFRRRKKLPQRNETRVLSGCRNCNLRQVLRCLDLVPLDQGINECHKRYLADMLKYSASRMNSCLLKGDPITDPTP